MDSSLTRCQIALDLRICVDCRTRAGRDHSVSVRAVKIFCRRSARETPRFGAEQLGNLLSHSRGPKSAVKISKWWSRTIRSGLLAALNAPRA